MKYDYLNVPGANILSFKFDEQVEPAIIDKTSHTVAVEVTAAANLKSLKPYITIPGCASISPQSEQLQDYSSVFEYLVTDKFDNKQVWKVVVNQNKMLSVCSGDPVLLQGRAGISTPSAVRWEVSETPDEWKPAGSNLKDFTSTGLVNTSPSPRTLQYRSLETISATQILTSLYTVVVYPAMPNRITAARVSLCANDQAPVNITDETSLAVNGFSWEYSADEVNWLVIANEQGRNLVINSSEKAGYYRRKLTTATCLSISNSIHIMQFTSVTTAVAGTDQVHCDETTFDLAANGPDSMETGTWSVLSPQGQDLINVANRHSPSTRLIVPKGSEVVLKWTIVNNFCPDLESESTITLKNGEKPVVTLPATVTVFKGNSITLPASLIQANRSYAYSWKPEAGLSNPYILNPVVIPEDNTDFTLTVTDMLNCSASYTVKVIVNKSIVPVNAFSPNNDGINDLWVIDGASQLDNIDVQVFNRYGERCIHFGKL